MVYEGGVRGYRSIGNSPKINPILRASNMVYEKGVRRYRKIVNSRKNPITGGKDKNPNHISASAPVETPKVFTVLQKDKDNNPNYKSASAPVEKIPLPSFFPVVQDAKKARKALKQFEKIKSSKDLERFVKKYEKLFDDGAQT